VNTETVSVEVSQTPPGGWDDYVRGHVEASPYHLAESVQIGRKVFGFRCHFIVARQGRGGTCGVLPLVEQPGLLSGRQLVSLPFFNYGGILADDLHAASALARAGEILAAQRRVERIELRHAQICEALSYPATLEKAALILELPPSPSELLKRFDSKLRSQIRRADRENPEVRVGGAELVRDFYEVFCSVMRDLGTPVYPRRFFDCVLREAGLSTTVVVIYLHDVPVSGAVLVEFGKRLEIPWAATLSRVKGQAINMRLYWEVLQLAIARGCTSFDFGRATLDSGPYRFKRQWGAKPRQLHWQHWSRSGVAPRERSERQQSLKLAVELWQRLPLRIANWLGPRISHRLPW
jgi:FemAB-related protein (PEP-CTERM system-associated)